MSDDRYIKDPISGALINTDDSEYKRLLSMREHRRKEAEKDKEIASLKEEMNEIKDMLKLLINKGI